MFDTIAMIVGYTILIVAGILISLGCIGEILFHIEANKTLKRHEEKMKESKNDV